MAPNDRWHMRSLTIVLHNVNLQALQCKPIFLQTVMNANKTVHETNYRLHHLLHREHFVLKEVMLYRETDCTTHLRIARYSQQYACPVSLLNFRLSLIDWYVLTCVNQPILMYYFILFNEPNQTDATISSRI